MKKLLLTLSALILLATQALASDFDVYNDDGINIYYNITSDTTVEVTFFYDVVPPQYSGIVNIPAEVTYDDVTYSVTAIGFNAFVGSNELTAVTLPDGIVSIGKNAFEGCINVTSIILPETVTFIDEYAFSQTGLTSITIPDGIATIKKYTFDGCGSLVSAELPNSLTAIGTGAFTDCGVLSSIVIPENVTSIGQLAFYRCNQMQTVTIPDGVTYIGTGAFKKCSSLQSMTIPASLSSLEDELFSYCSSLTSVSIHENISSIGKNVFLGCANIVSIDVDADNQYFTSVDGVLFNKSMTTLIKYPEGKINDNYLISNGITTVTEYAFSKAMNLTSVTIPETVINIGNNAFNDCQNLTSVNIPSGITIIEDGVFYGCRSLNSIEIPEGVTSVGNGSFSICSSLQAVVIPEGVTSIGNQAFSACLELNSISLPNSLTFIDNRAFESCTALESVIIPEGVTSIKELVFHQCQNMTSVTIPSTVKIIYNNAFFGCHSLLSIDIPENVVSIGEYAFGQCQSLSTITIPEGIKAIERGLFSMCSGLRSINLPASTKSIDIVAFKECNSLDTIRCLALAPPAINELHNAPASTTIVVPCMSLNAYRTTLVWSDFTDFECVDIFPFAPVGAEWYFDKQIYGTPGGIGYHHIECIGDTVILGHNVKIISPPIYSNQNEYIYDDNGVVYWYNKIAGNFTVLYDFNAEAGEGWFIDIDTCSYYVSVNSVTEETINGMTHRVQHVSSEDILNFSGRIINGIGYEIGLFPSFTACGGSIICGDFIDYLRCYLVDGEMFYKQGIYDCDEIIDGSITFWDGGVADCFDGGTGTASDPYLIRTGKQLALLANMTNEGNANFNSAHYRQTKDIYLNTYYSTYYEWGEFPAQVDHEWTSIGVKVEDDSNPYRYFSGTYDGDGYAVHGLYQHHDSVSYNDAKGLFGAAMNAKIKNVELRHSYIEENGMVGGIVGYAKNIEMQNCITRDAIIKSNRAAGGIAGKLSESCNLYDCSNSADIQSDSIAGGVVGMFDCYNSKIRDCNNTGDISGYDNVAGISGYLNGFSITVSHCVNEGNISGHSCLGGVAGKGDGLIEIDTCENKATIRGEAGYIGGIQGYAAQRTDMRDCVNNGFVISPDDYIGGIAGILEVGYLFGCINNTAVEGEDFVGGLVGCSAASLIVNSANKGNIVGDSCVGGLFGEHFSVDIMADPTGIFNSYNVGSVIGRTYVGGISGRQQQGRFINIYNTGSLYGVSYTGILTGENTSKCKNFYWLGNADYPIYGDMEYSLEIDFSSSFHQGDTPTSWILDTIQYQTDDLVAAMNAGKDYLDQTFYHPPFCNYRNWIEDENLENNGFPVFEDEYLPFSPAGAEWYYEILGANGIVTYQHLMYASDTTVNHKDVKVIIRTNTLYDKKHTTTTREYIYEENDTVYWYNTTLDIFTMLYDFSAEEGDEWQIFVEDKVITMHVDGTEMYEYEGVNYKILHVSDNGNVFSGDIVRNIGHLTSFFPEALMSTRNDFRANGMRCFWIDGELVFKMGNSDCDAIYQTFIGLEEQSSENLRIYPNPAKDVLYIESGEMLNCNYFIYNMMGQIEKQGILNENEINISELKNGLYLLDCNGVTLRFLKMK